MAKNILVATPQPAFGELLRLSLEESGRYRVRLVKTGRDALASAELSVFALAILDASLAEPPFPYVVNGLRIRWPGLHMLVIPPPPGVAIAKSVTIPPADYLSQPFQAEALLGRIDALTAEMPSARAETPGPHDTTLVSQYLESFLVDSMAPGVVIVRARLPWAAAGQLAPEALTEITQLLFHYAEANEGVDLARFVRLTSDGSEYLVYATPLPNEMVLALIYQSAIPLTVIRVQAARLARRLREPGILPVLPPQAIEKIEAVVIPSAPPIQLDVTPAELKTESVSVHPEPDAVFDEPIPLDEDESEDPQLESDALRLVDLLAEMPAPNPENETAPFSKDAEDLTPDDELFLFPWERTLAHNPAQVAQEVATAADDHPEITASDSERPAPVANLEATAPVEQIPVPEMSVDVKNPPLPPLIKGGKRRRILPSLDKEGRGDSSLTSLDKGGGGDSSLAPLDKGGGGDSSLTPLDKGGQGGILSDPEATRRSVLTPYASELESSTAPTQAMSRETSPNAETRPSKPHYLESIQQTTHVPPVSSLAYTCVLVPRMPGHLLVNQLTQRMMDWLPQLCIAYGWQIVSMLVQPEYLQWTVQVAPAISPGNVVRLIRQQTSRRIFAQLPQYEVENPSGDFWAPGFLIISGTQPPSHEVVRDFIYQTRNRQSPWFR
jgi:REP element-mobilizing transposase RayT/ActR/RegA family two-component response regulator